MKKRVD